ncbi:hypothetical protein B0T11DRAFT_295581 [Plectosphaerella cucumerina]|uniref:Uncharacterized protein n=1 Tax=Plectosphaerella cucumerina TaxID=40658 RepID=A0A8K0TIN3_9PEZI|nr:hypothetical protein B0T11DRAFT_295581 [Plectosphaerella cucumerina]
MEENVHTRLQDVSARLVAQLHRGEWRDIPCLRCSKDLAYGKNPHCFDCYTKGFQCTALRGYAGEAAVALREGMRCGNFNRGKATVEELMKAAQEAIESHESAKRTAIENSRNTFAWGDIAPSPVGSVIQARASSHGSFRWGEAIDNGKPAQRAGIGGMPNADYTPSTSSASVQSDGDNVSYKAPVAKSVDSDEPIEEKPAPSNNSMHSTVPYSLRSASDFDSWGFPVAQIKNKVNYPAATRDPEQSLANTDVDMAEHHRLIKENMRLIDDYQRLVEDHQQKADENKRVVDDYKRLTEEVKQMAKNYERMASDFRCMASDFQLMAMNYSSMMEEKSAAAKEKKIRNDQIMALLE